MLSPIVPVDHKNKSIVSKYEPIGWRLQRENLVVLYILPLLYNKSKFVSIRNLDTPFKISITNGTTVEADSTVLIPVSLSNGENVTIHDALYVPELYNRKLSIPALVDRGVKVSFGDKWSEI